MKATILIVSAVIASAAQAAPYEVPMIDAATGALIPGSEAKANPSRFKVEIPAVMPGAYRVCVPMGIGALDLGSTATDDDGELKLAGDLPTGDYPLSFTVHADDGACSSAPSFYSAEPLPEADDEEDLDAV